MSIVFIVMDIDSSADGGGQQRYNAYAKTAYPDFDQEVAMFTRFITEYSDPNAEDETDKLKYKTQIVCEHNRKEQPTHSAF